VSGDDIVDRLRIIDNKYTEFWQQRLMDEAADEIERLRAAGDALAEACAFVRAHPAEVTRALTAWQEARRG